MQPVYRVLETNEVGVVVPCPCDDPIILQFKDGVRDAFHLRELEPTIAPISMSNRRDTAAKNGRKGRPKGIGSSTIKNMLDIHAFLLTQTKPVYRGQIQKAVGFDITRPMIKQQSHAPGTITLESLGIVERIPSERPWTTWQLTQLGRARGEALINSLK